MRSDYHDRLDALTTGLADMCGLAATAIERATDGLLHADLSIAERVISDHDDLVERKAALEEAAFILLALQAPVAGELRAIVSTLRNVSDAERMGGLALHVAKIARLRHPSQVLADDVSAVIAEMGTVAVDLAQAARDVVLSTDPERAARLRHDDDAMNDLHRHLFTLLMDRQWPHGVAAAVDLTLLGRFYERFADHAVEIGRRVVFQATGETPDSAD